MNNLNNTSKLELRLNTQYNDFNLDICLKNNNLLKEKHYNFAFYIYITHNFDYYHKWIEMNEIIDLIKKYNSNSNDKFIEIIKIDPELIITNIKNNNFTIKENFAGIELNIYIEEFSKNIIFYFKKEDIKNSYRFKINRLEKKFIELEKIVLYIDSYQKYNSYFSPIILFLISTIIFTINLNK